MFALVQIVSRLFNPLADDSQVFSTSQYIAASEKRHKENPSMIYLNCKGLAIPCAAGGMCLTASVLMLAK